MNNVGRWATITTLAAIGCSDGTTEQTLPTATTPTTPNATAVASVTVSPATCTLSVGGSCTVVATPRDASGNALTGRTTAWTTSNAAIATVTSTGSVTGVAVGSTTITATSEGKTAAVDVTVAATSATTVLVQVDASATGPVLADLLGVNKTPKFNSQTPGISYDASALYTAFSVSHARAQDGTVDNCAIYTPATKVNVDAPSTPILGCTLTPNGGPPHFSWTPASTADADLNNPANYNFTGVDEAMATATATGAKFYLRLGDAYNGANDTADPIAFAKVSANIYRHVIGQFKPGAISVDPAFVEVMNEPDGVFWRGTSARFDSVFTEIVARVRTAAAAAGKTVIVGGPGFTTNYLTQQNTATNVANNFIRAVGVANLDFFAVHHYGSCASATLSAAAAFLRSSRAYADAQGFTGKPMQVGEWNIGLGMQCGEAQYADPRMMSYASGVLTLMQDPAQRIRAAEFYAGVTVMSVFDLTSVAGKARVNPSAWAYWAHARLKGATSLSAQVCPNGTNCVNGYAAESQPLLALGGVSNGVRYAVVTNDGATAVTYLLRVKGLSGASVNATILNPPLAVQELPVSGSPLKPSAADVAALMTMPTSESRNALGVSGGQVEMTLTIPAHAVQVIEIR